MRAVTLPNVTTPARDSAQGSTTDAPADWRTHGATWPNREHSRFVRAAGIRWHVQVMGRGPVALLVHGTGGATHSWRDVAPLLARHFTVVAPDLPGHGFTEVPRARRLSLAAMSEDVSALLVELALAPVLAVGHSAGGAVLLRMALDGRVALGALLGVNAALEPPPALYSSLLGPLIGRVATSALVAQLAAHAAARDGVVRSLLRSTGSGLDAEQVARYEALFRSAPRVGAVLTMMASWELGALQRDLPRLAVPTTLIAASDDPWVPPAVARGAARRIPHALVVSMSGGHLAHEVEPAIVVGVIEEAARMAGLLGPSAAD
jgi:magnesium chelatase accessory protein